MANNKNKNYNGKTKPKTGANKSTNRKGSGNSDRLPADSLNKRKDIIDNMNGGHKSKGEANDHTWYYGNDVIADEISRFSFNQFVGLPDKETSLYASNTASQYASPSTSLPSVMVMPINPCPGVTELDDSDSTKPTVYTPRTGRGINLALTQWWSLLTAKSGRGADWTKNDLGALLLEVGELISTSEHYRRFFGIAFNYSLRNRTLPKLLLESMGLDADDFFAHLADYRLRFNTTLLRINKIPIPTNINYFKKCQDMYQKVYVDSTSAMAQYYVQVPATTWTIREGLYEHGTVLETTSMYYTVRDRSTSTTVNMYLDSPKTFSEYLDILNSMIDEVLMSSTFSRIYSDMLNAASMGTINLWSADMVAEDYGKEGMFEYNEYALLMFHNAMATGTIAPTSNTVYTTDEPCKHGTPLNDVVLDIENDVILYNPQFKTSVITGSAKCMMEPLIADFLLPETDVSRRIEANVFKVGGFNEQIDTKLVDNVTVVRNMDLPDHYIMEFLFFNDQGKYMLSEHACYLDEVERSADMISNHSIPSGVDVNALEAYTLTKFDWAPLVFRQRAKVGVVQYPTGIIGDLNYWTKLSQTWYKNVNDAKQFGLFQIL